MNGRVLFLLGVGAAVLLATVGRARGGDDPPSVSAAATVAVAKRADATATSLTITPQQSSLILGTDDGTTLLVTINGPLAGVATPGRTLTTVGEVGPLVPNPARPGTFTAAYRVPLDRVPQSAIISAEVLLPGGTRLHGTTRIWLPAATTVPFRSSPNANVTLQIADTVFGPRKADAVGNVSIPVIVLPGVAKGQARAVNKFGMDKVTDVDLQAQDYPRVLLIGPPDGDAGQTVDVEVLAVDPGGEPSPPEDIDLRASSGTVRRIGGAAGVARFAVTLPEQIGGSAEAGTVALVGSMDDGTSVRPDAIVVHAGPTTQIGITADVGKLIVGTPTVAHVTVVAQDSFGNATTVSGMTVSANGSKLPTTTSPAGLTGQIAAPVAWGGRENIVIQASLGAIRREFLLPVSGGKPARVQLTANGARVEGDGNAPVDLTLDVVDEKGTPTSATRVTWHSDDGGVITLLPAPRFGTHAARFIPRRVLRDRSAVVVAIVDDGVTANARIMVEAGGARTAAARVGVLSNLGSGIGQAAFVEATMPLGHIKRLGRLGRLLSAGVAVGYLHTETSTTPAAMFSSVHVDINQFPLLGLGRLRMPAQLPVEFSLLGAAGITFSTSEVAPIGNSAFGPARGTAHAFVVGGGADASVILHPGELVIGARYLHARLGRDSNGDRIEGNGLGLICDLGFRMGF